MQKRWILALAMALTGLCACEQELPDDPIPNVLVNTQINLNSLLYDDLRLIGGSAYIDNVGVRGIVVYRASTNEYRAFDRACIYHEEPGIKPSRPAGRGDRPENVPDM